MENSQKKWKPKKDEDTFWFITNNGQVTNHTLESIKELYSEDYVIQMFLWGNCFKTEEEAKAVSEKVSDLLKEDGQEQVTKTVEKMAARTS